MAHVRRQGCFLVRSGKSGQHAGFAIDASRDIDRVIVLVDKVLPLSRRVSPHPWLRVAMFALPGLSYVVDHTRLSRNRHFTGA